MEPAHCQEKAAGYEAAGPARCRPATRRARAEARPTTSPGLAPHAPAQPFAPDGFRLAAAAAARLDGRALVGAWVLNQWLHDARTHANTHTHSRKHARTHANTHARTRTHTHAQ